MSDASPVLLTPDVVGGLAGKRVPVSYTHLDVYKRQAEKTVPLGAARNLAIAKAEGSLLAFLDCDDEWLSTKLEKQVMLFNANPRLGLVSTDTEMFSEKGTLSRMFESTHPARGMVFRELMTRQWISMSSAMIRKSALDSLGAVSYTHLDVYKRQPSYRWAGCGRSSR